MSAAFILIGSKVGDLIGRKRAYVLGLLGRFISTYLSWRVQLALIVAILASVLGLLRSFRMRRLGDPEPSGSADGMVLG